MYFIHFSKLLIYFIFIFIHIMIKYISMKRLKKNEVRKKDRKSNY